MPIPGSNGIIANNTIYQPSSDGSAPQPVATISSFLSGLKSAIQNGAQSLSDWSNAHPTLSALLGIAVPGAGTVMMASKLINWLDGRGKATRKDAKAEENFNPQTRYETSSSGSTTSSTPSMLLPGDFSPNYGTQQTGTVTLY